MGIYFAILLTRVYQTEVQTTLALEVVDPINFTAPFYHIKI